LIRSLAGLSVRQKTSSLGRPTLRVPKAPRCAGSPSLVSD
jgi:hypothetical protein